MSVRTGYNLQDYFHSVFFSYRLDGVSVEGSVGNCLVWQLLVGYSVWKLLLLTHPALYLEVRPPTQDIHGIFTLFPLESE